MEERSRDDLTDNSDEIAAALAAIYAYCQNSQPSIKDEAAERPGAWAVAARLEAIVPRTIVSAAAFPIQKGLGWRQSFARKWTTLSIGLILAGMIQPSTAQALERIQFAAESRPPAESKTGSVLAASSSAKERSVNSPAADFDAAAASAGAEAAGSSLSIKIALKPDTTSADIVVPDGAQIIDERSGHLLAELPPQSRWQVGMDDGSSGRRLAVRGKLPHAASGKLLVASSPSRFTQAGYTTSFKVTGKGGFTRPPQVIDSVSPKFFLPVRMPATLGAAKQSLYRRVSVQDAPALLTPAAAKAAAPPQVVNGYIIRPRDPDGVISCDGKTYRGEIILKPRYASASFLVINKLDLEDYLLSVVPSEMPSGWSLEALKAQSIAARSFALANLGKHQSEAYDLKAGTEDQVYLGVQSEADSSNRAVAETKGQVLKHNGQVVSAFFHSAGGGCTERAENVYGKKLPYLKSVPDFDEQSPHFNWNRAIPVATIEDNLKKQGKEIGGLLGIFPLERSSSQRVTSALLAGTLQSLILSGEELRRVLGLPSTVFNIGEGPEAYLLAGRGFGHGLGMSQWGAKYLSEQGYNASQILSYYYKDVSVDLF